MSKKYPPLTAKDVQLILRKLGYKEIAQKGSHRQFQKEGETRKVTVAQHSGTIPPGTLKSIMLQVGLNRDDFYRVFHGF